MYNQVGDLGEGYMLLNIQISTLLVQYNEYVIYDTPDVNQSMSDYFRVYIPQRMGELSNEIKLDTNGHYVETEDTNEQTRMEMQLYISIS